MTSPLLPLKIAGFSTALRASLPPLLIHPERSVAQSKDQIRRGVGVEGEGQGEQ
jgi:hypothetical protein